MRSEATCPVSLTPPLRPFRPEDAAPVAQLNDMASDGIVLTTWQRKAGPDGDPWAFGRNRQIERMESGQIMVVADRGTGAEAVLMGNPIGTEPEPTEGVDPEWVSLVELENLALGSWYLNVIATLPEARRQGHGARLMDVADAIARAGGHDEISLIVSDANATARRLYDRSGYSERATRPMVKGAWEGPGTAWVLLTKSLA